MGGFDWVGLSESGNVKHIDEYEKCIEFTDGKKIPLDAIRDIKIEG